MFKVRVPATSANLGPGFDTLGIALGMYNEFSFKEISKGLEITGCKEEYRNKENLVYKAMEKTFERLNFAPKGIKIGIKSEIPDSRGLGSSATCILAGVIGACKLAKVDLDRENILELATEIEGHPDNIAPALFGGLVTSILENGNIYYNNIKVEKGLKFIALIPDFTLSTRDSRGVLPNNIKYEDGIYNVGRIALLISALNNGKFNLLKYGLEDRLHEKYRSSLIRGYDKIMKKSEDLNIYGSYLSGAGPTIMLLADEKEEVTLEMEEFLSGLEDKWTIKELNIDYKGVEIL